MLAIGMENEYNRKDKRYKISRLIDKLLLTQQFIVPLGCGLRRGDHMNIRLARTGDIPGLISLLLQVGQVHHELRPDIFRPVTQKYDDYELSELLKDERRPIFVAMDGDFVAGYCFCILRAYQSSSVCVDHKDLYIDDLCVDESRRGQGIATALYRHAVDYARSQGCKFVSLNVWNGNNALRFYEKMGMRPRSITMETPLEEAYAD